MTRIIIAGSRSFNNYRLLRSKLDEIIAGINDEIEIVSGNARGADRLGERYASEHNISVALFPADWSVFGKPAGIIRNQIMVNHVSKGKALVVVFWDGESRGALDMIQRARRAGIETKVIRTNGDMTP